VTTACVAYEDGLVTLWHGGWAEVLPQLSDVALTVTSPPYNIGGFDSTSEASNAALTARGRAWKERSAGAWYDDLQPEPDYQAGQAALAAAIRQASRPGASYWYNHKQRWVAGELVHPVDLARSWPGWKLRQEVIWNRHPQGAMPGNGKMTVRHESLLWLTDDRARPTFHRRAIGWGTVWSIQSFREPGVDHPCPFPKELPARAILATTSRGDLVLDPYSGSGTTLLAAAALGRRAVGIERDPAHIAETIARLETR